MTENDFQYGGWNSYTLQCGTIVTLISPGDCTSQCGLWLWNHDSEFTQFTQVAAPWNVIRGSGMTCNWIRLVAAPCNVTRSSGIMTLNSLGSSNRQCGRWLWDYMPLNSPKRLPYWNSKSGFDFDHITAVDMSFCKILSKLDHPHQKKMTLCRFSRWRISAILDFTGPIMGSLKSPCTISYRSLTETIALNYLVFEKISFWHFRGFVWGK